MTPSTLDQASKEDLRDELMRIKAREKKAKDEGKAKTQKIIGSIFTIGTGAALAHVLGGKEREAKKLANWDTLSDEKKQEAIAKEQQIIGGIDIDLGVGLVGLAVGLSDASGDFADTLMSVGVGGLTCYATRAIYARAAAPEAPEEAAGV